MLTHHLHLGKIWALIGLVLIVSATTARADSVTGTIPVDTHPTAVAVNPALIKSIGQNSIKVNS